MLTIHNCNSERHVESAVQRVMKAFNTRTQCTQVASMGINLNGEQAYDFCITWRVMFVDFRVHEQG